MNESPQEIFCSDRVNSRFQVSQKVSDRKQQVCLVDSLFGLCGERGKNGLVFLGLLGGATLAQLAILLSLRLGLILEHLRTGLLCLLLVNVLHQNTFVLEYVTLCLQVELVVHMFVEFLRLAVLGEEAAEDAHATNPEELDGHASIGGTLAFTGASVTTLATCLNIQSGARTRVNGDGLANDQTVLDQTSHLMARVGVGNVCVLVGVEPDLVLAALHY